MNYRHAFHAGNFADVLKHIVIARIITHLLEKPAPFRVIDTHAGIGLYDLAAHEAGRTREWEGGIGQVLASPHLPELAPLLAPYFEAITRVRIFHNERSYPGSPEIARGMLRGEDRLILVEKHPADAETLKKNFAFDGRAKVLMRDGYESLLALVPPKERRGLILIDPPYEDRDEFAHLLNTFVPAYRKFPTGIYAIWYPIKAGSPVDSFHQALKIAGIPKILRIELRVRADNFGTGLSGSGLIIVNPPWRLKEEMDTLLPWLDQTLAANDGHGIRCDWLAGEKLPPV